MKSEPRLFYYLRRYKDKDYPDKKIELLLSNKGYTQKDIQDAINDFENAKDHKDEDKLVKYFEKHSKKGYALQNLVDHAIEKKVDKHLIQRAILRAQIKGDENARKEEEELDNIIKDDNEPVLQGERFTWRDALLLFPVSALIALSFFDPITPFATVILLSIYLLRIIGVSPKPLAHVNLISGIAFCGFAAFFFPTLFPITAGLLLLCGALLLYLPSHHVRSVHIPS